MLRMCLAHRTQQVILHLTIFCRINYWLLLFPCVTRQDSLTVILSSYINVKKLTDNTYKFDGRQGSQHISMLLIKTMDSISRHTECIFCKLCSTWDKVEPFCVQLLIVKRIRDHVGVQLNERNVKNTKFQKYSIYFKNHSEVIF